MDFFSLLENIRGFFFPQNENKRERMINIVTYRQVFVGPMAAGSLGMPALKRVAHTDKGSKYFHV